MLLRSWLGGRHPLGGRNTNSRNPRTLRRRPLVERLEDRLPPGDAALAGLLAGDLLLARVATLNPAAPPGEARRLTAPGDGIGDFTLLAGVTDDAASVAVPVAKRTRLDRGGRTAEEPFARPVAAAHGGVSQDGRSLHDFGSLPSPALAPLSVGAAAAVFAPPAPANDQLDRAAAALGVPLADPEESPDPALDAGPEVQSGGARALFDLGQPTTGPFPSNVFTVPDPTHNTGRRVHLPLPDCQVRVSDCEDLAVLNALDGFNLQPRLSVPFSGPIDVHSVSGGTVFLVSLGSALEHGGDPRGTVIGINQTVWDVATNTLHVESDALLAQHTRYALVVTNGVRDASGDPVEASPAFRRFRQTVPQPYKRELLDAIHEARRLGVRERDIAVASVFTTQSATAVLEKIRDQLKAQTPELADFLLGPNGERTVFNLDAVTGIRWNQQVRDNPPEFNAVNLNLSLLRDIIPGTVGQVAFGKYLAPDYAIHPGEFIPPVGTRTGTPVVQRVNEVFFNLVLPSGQAPGGGWPVAIFAHGTTNNKNETALFVAATLAQHGIATLAINAVGHGFGPLGTLTVNPMLGSPVTFAAGGRGFDQNRDRIIDNTEGFQAARPHALVSDSDGIRQTVVDLMQLVRILERGMDVDADGSRDVDPTRISYLGYSLGSAIGTPLFALDASVRAGVFNVPSGSRIEATRLGLRRPGTGNALAARVPSLINSPGVTVLDGVAMGAPHFHENVPLRNGVPFTVRLADGTDHVIQSPVVNTVPGASAIQEVLENMEWVSQSSNVVTYATHLRRDPLPGVPIRPVLFVFGKGDQIGPNPANTAILRAGNLADRTTFYRTDLAFAEDPSVPRNPHLSMMLRLDLAGLAGTIARGVQQQVATFFATDGTEIIHPEPRRFFEVPIALPLPEDLNYIP